MIIHKIIPNNLILILVNLGLSTFYVTDIINVLVLLLRNIHVKDMHCCVLLISMGVDHSRIVFTFLHCVMREVIKSKTYKVK